MGHMHIITANSQKGKMGLYHTLTNSSEVACL